MSQQLARRTGTVGALAVLAGVTSVAGIWPVVGTASAAELRPGRVHQAAEKVGRDAAPGQVQKAAEPAAEPGAETEVAGETDLTVAAAPAPVVGQETEQQKTEQQRSKQQKAGEQGAAKQEPTTGPPTGVAAVSSGGQAGPKAAAGPAAAGAGEAPAAQPAPAAEPKAAPATKPKPVPAAKPKAAPAAKAGPVAPQAPAEVAPASTSGRGVLAASPRTARAPRLQPPPAAQPPAGSVTGPVTGPAVGPFVGPVVPPAAPSPARLSHAIPRSLGSTGLGLAGSGAASRVLPVAATDPVPLRPAGAQPVAASPSRVSPRTDPLAISLTGLPGFATGTAEAVARRPELPLGLAAVVVVFLLLQSRIDRRDPKLALAPIEEDEPLEFGLPGTLGVRLVSA